MLNYSNNINTKGVLREVSHPQKGIHHQEQNQDWGHIHTMLSSAPISATRTMMLQNKNQSEQSCV